jgi:hypothetical protein
MASAVLAIVLVSRGVGAGAFFIIRCMLMMGGAGGNSAGGRGAK